MSIIYLKKSIVEVIIFSLLVFIISSNQLVMAKSIPCKNTYIDKTNIIYCPSFHKANYFFKRNYREKLLISNDVNSVNKIKDKINQTNSVNNEIQIDDNKLFNEPFNLNKKFQKNNYLEDNKVPPLGNNPVNDVFQDGIEENVEFASLPYKLTRGSLFDEKQLKAIKIWYRIPNWLAGTWQSDSFIIDGNTYEKKFVFTVGKLPDRNGDIWDTVTMPNISYPCPLTRNLKKILLEFKASNSYKNDFTLKYLSYFFKVNPFTKKIVNDFLTKSTEYHTFTLIEPGCVKFQVNDTYRGGENNESASTKNVAYVAKNKNPFKPKNYSDSGEDLKADFIQFLKSHNLSTLIPN